jgi:quercetin dioxygenase-like cupin family protein
MTLESLAADSGLSPGYLSQIENGQAVPSLTALQMVAAELRVDVSTFFHDVPRTSSQVVRASERSMFRFAESSRHEFTVLTQQVTDSAFSAIYYRIGPGGAHPPHRHLGEEFVLVLVGRLSFRIDDESYVAGPGDWMHYSSQQNHITEALEPVEALWILTPAII